jgi:glycosyltransferase involved in cell wall biosynthesis
LGRVSEAKLREVYSKAQAFLFPQEEDFGIVAIEALASGRPVIALRAGDIVEHVEEGKNGVFFDEQTKGRIIEAVRRFQKIDFDSEYIRSTALHFETRIFKGKMKQFVEQEYDKFKNKDVSKKDEFLNSNFQSNKKHPAFR